MPIAVALVASLAVQQLIGGVIPPDAYIYRLFRPSGGWIMSVLPALIVFVLVWTLTDLLLKFRSGRANELDLARQDIRHIPMLVGQEGVVATLQRMRGMDRRILARPVGRRVVWLLNHLAAGADAQRMHELLRHQSDLDADAAASGYRTVTLFIWAMPILGFIGTVLGISLAVGGFSDFLTTNVSIEEIDRVTAELGEVASGLSFAFDTTLLGLLAGLLASVVSSGVRKREEQVLTGLDELGLRVMEYGGAGGAMGAAPASPQGLAPSEDFVRAMHARLEDVTGQMERFTRTSDELVTRTGALMEELNAGSSRASEALSASVSSVSGSVEDLATRVHGVSQELAEILAGLGERMQGVSGTLSETLGELGERVRSSEERLQSGLGTLADAIGRSEEQSTAALVVIQESNESLRTALASSTEQVAQASDRLLSGLQAQEGVDESVRGLSEAVTGLGGELAELRQVQEGLKPALELAEAIGRNEEQSAAALASIQESNESLRTAVTNSTEQMAQASDRLLSALEAQQGVDESVRGLSAAIAQLGEELSELRQVQDGLKPVLSQLVGPLELRLTPSVAVAQGDSGTPAKPKKK